MNSKRLLMVADLMDVTPRKGFNLASNEDCAIGHACRLPYFKRIGLECIDDVISFNGSYGHTAIAECFKIGFTQAENLFCGNPLYGYSKLPTPKQVAKAIRKFVEENS